MRLLKTTKKLPLRRGGAEVFNIFSASRKGFTHIYLAIIFAIAITACGSAASQEVLPTVSLDSAAQPAASSAQISGATAKGTVIPITKVELSFPAGGIVTGVHVVEGDAVAKGQMLITQDTTILEARVKEAEAAVVTQETQVLYLKRTGTTQERLDAAIADVERMQATVDNVKAQLAQATLLAPFDGTIASVTVSPAEYANAGQIVLIMGDLTRFKIETTDLNEKDAANVQIGQRANVFIEALNKDVAGKVTDVARVSQKIGGDVVFTVTIELDEQPVGLRWGMTADVTIETK